MLSGGTQRCNIVTLLYFFNTKNSEANRAVGTGSVLTGPQVPSAYHAMCGIQREAKQNNDSYMFANI